MSTRGVAGNIGTTTSSVTFEVTEGRVKAALVLGPACPSAQTVLSGESQRDAKGHSPQRGLRASQILLPNQII